VFDRLPAAAPSTRPPTVSIGVPIYNGGRFIAQALDSLLGQTFLDIELIISDNASTDDSAAICQAFAARDSRIRYVRQAVNIGAPRNWNFVAEQARGKYLKWSSANDLCDKTMLERCVAVMAADPGVVLCHGRTCLVDEETNAHKAYEHDISATEGRPSDRFKTIFRTIELNNAQSGLIRLDALRSTSLDRPYPHGDLVLMAELALRGRFVLLPEVLLYRRVGRETSSMRLTSAALQAFFDPMDGKRPGFNLLRRHLDYFLTVACAPIDLTEKLRTLLLVARHANWDRRLLWAELRDALRTRSA